MIEQHRTGFSIIQYVHFVQLQDHTRLGNVLKLLRYKSPSSSLIA